MASDYAYTTIADLEKHGVIDYGTVDTALTDAVVDSKISDAEKYVNAYVGTTFTGTIPDIIELVSKMISKIFMDNHMIEQKIGPYGDAGGVIIDILERYDIVQILESLKSQYSSDKGIWVKKHTHTARSNLYSRRPLGWQ